MLHICQVLKILLYCNTDFAIKRSRKLNGNSFTVIPDYVHGHGHG